MRIVIVTDNLSFSRGGSECYLLSLITRLIANSHDVHVFHYRGRDQVEGGKYYQVRVLPYPRFLREWSFCRRVDRRVQDSHHGCEFKHSPQAHATQLQLSRVIARSNPCDRKKSVRFPPLQTTIRRASVLRRKEYRLGELSQYFSAERR